ncbi:UNVERIFIED_ORG: site-specific DNA-methyltransferase [Lacrimispora saccharolytica]
MHTPNKADENFKKLAALFPNAVTETTDENGEVVRAIDKDVLMQEISCTVVDGNEERYQFTWPDKKKSVLLANAPISKTLRPCCEESVGKDGTPGSFDSENLYIEGDNLEVLKLLQETYLGKIKMIYIDPPYNTGNDFVYEDDFTKNIDEYLSNSGQFDEEGNRMIINTESNGRFHTDWLNMIFVRLRLAKDLLSDDGFIFISIGEEEIENLYKVCDEVFGSELHLGTFIWKRRQMVDSRSKTGVSEDHEYLLCFAKQKNNRIRGQNTDMSKYSNPDNDPRGDWMSADMTGLATASQRPNLHYDLKNPKTGIVYLCPPNGWRYERKRMSQLIENDEVIFPENPNGRPRRKKFARDLQSAYSGLSTVLNTVFNTQATRELKTIFDGEDYFDFPKPVDYIKMIIEQGSSGNDIVLDFFSGSATTAHAVMQLNAEDGGRRKFIMVQLPEKTDEKSEAYKAGYKNICEIGKERIRRAGKKIKEDSPLTTQNLDIGFRVLKCDTSNMKDVYYSPTDYDANLFDLMTDNIKEDRTPEDLLFQVMLDLGIELSSKIEETEIAGKKVFDVAAGFLIACFDADVTDETIKAIAQKQPYYFVMRDSSLANDSVAANFEQIFATYSPDTVRKVL